MRLVVVLGLLIACKDAEKKAPPPPAPPVPVVAPDADDMDEKMRHCPLSVAGARVMVSDVDGGVQLEIRSAQGADEIRKRAHHVVEFAAGRAAAGQHGGGNGGGTMRNCPVVTSAVTIEAADLPDGARLIVRPLVAGDLETLRQETHERSKRFTFDGVTISY